ncbi:unnamed protein product [Spirodela intermedia]|uniref:Uncharacterized protein n=1 Tax=Spirodela intermedia TaxID=51605 RepID=A0A7I8IYF6_SPIIN|nr:unnamed protein product [Spirodela intermedia]CAA6662839.1 unnamed protein product [Spirodela intermedia]
MRHLYGPILHILLAQWIGQLGLSLHPFRFAKELFIPKGLYPLITCEQFSHK